MLDTNKSERLLITGASSDIGKAIAVRLSAANSLVLAGRNAERLEAVRLCCREPQNHRLWCMDFSNPEQTGNELIEFLSANQIAISGFVHAAGMVTVLPVRLLDPAAMRQMMNVNFFSAVEIVRTLTKKLINGKSLHKIVFISSISSLRGTSGYCGYSATRGAIDAYMRGLAVELAPQVRVNSVLPGAIRTAATERVFASNLYAEQHQRDYPLGEGHPDDVAAIVGFLMSDEARWITGQQFVVDGGRTAH